MNESLTANTAANAGMVMRPDASEKVEAHGCYSVQCFDSNGQIKWVDKIENLVTTVGKNDLLDKYLSGSSYTAAPVIGLKGTGTAVVGDTQASHAGWLEVGLANAPAYSGNRKVPAFSAASAGSKATSAAVSFSFTSGGTVAGCFVNLGGSATVDNATGILYSAGDFSGGSRVVANGDTLNVTWTASA